MARFTGATSQLIAYDVCMTHVSNWDFLWLLTSVAAGAVGPIFVVLSSLRTLKNFRGPTANADDVRLYEALEDTSNTVKRIDGYVLTATATPLFFAARAHQNPSWLLYIVLVVGALHLMACEQKGRLLALYQFDKFHAEAATNRPIRTEVQIYTEFLRRHPKHGRAAKNALEVRIRQARTLAMKEQKWQTSLSKDVPKRE